MKKLIIIFLTLLATGLLVWFITQEQSVFTEADYSNYSDAIGPISASYMIYDKVNLAIDNSDLIVYGKIIEVRDPERIVIGYAHNNQTDLDEPIDLLYTFSSMEVDKCYKGNIEVGEIIETKQLAAEHMFNSDDENASHYYKVGEEYVFFLNSYYEIDEDTPTDPINPKQGQIKIDNKRVVKQNSIQFVKDGVSLEALDKELTKLLEQ